MRVSKIKCKQDKRGSSKLFVKTKQVLNVQSSLALLEILSTAWSTTGE